MLPSTSLEQPNDWQGNFEARYQTALLQWLGCHEEVSCLQLHGWPLLHQTGQTQGALSLYLWIDQPQQATGGRMLLEILMESHARGDLVCPWLCRFRRLKDGSVTIYELWVSPECRGRGTAGELVGHLKREYPVVRARCPADLPSNGFWEHMGFLLADRITLKSGRKINCWEWHRDDPDMVRGREHEALATGD
jgi:GNAT superfamily N-acetyltransferase